MDLGAVAGLAGAGIDASGEAARVLTEASGVAGALDPVDASLVEGSGPAGPGTESSSDSSVTSFLRAIARNLIKRAAGDEM